MFSSRPRPTAVLLLVLVCVASTITPAAAADPTPAPQPDAAEEVAPAPTIHHEMLEEHGDTAPAFAPGELPAPLDQAETGGGVMSLEGGTGGVTALPNGLSHEVYGYLPYWALTSQLLAYLDYRLVSTIAYFSVGARPDGRLDKTLSNGELTTGWKGWSSSAMTGVINRAHDHGVRVVLTVTMMAWDFDFDDMSELLLSTTNRNRLATEIASAVKARNADGVNLDFEPMPNSLQSPYTAFVRQVKSELLRLGAGPYVAVATTGGAATWDEGYDLAGLTAAGAADALMVMAYDFNWGGSSRAGGVAPIVSPYVLDSREAMRDYLARVPASKLIWGVPYYGRAWTTQSDQLNALTCRSTSICPTGDARAGAFGRSWAQRYVDARDGVSEHGRRWDATGQVPWYAYRSATYETWVQGYYDDAASLKTKYREVKASGLRGIGIWHLLMDVSRRELWDVLYTQFGPLPFTDISDSNFVKDIIWLSETGITSGCTETRFCPKGGVNRGQMASFLARALDLPPATRDWFVDDEGNKHESSINRLAESGITFGCGADRYCPAGLVARDQMATFLSRALKLPAASRDWYIDDTGNRHEERINRFAEAGVTYGCADNRFCPSGTVLREQMAAFLRRALGP